MFENSGVITSSHIQEEVSDLLDEIDHPNLAYAGDKYRNFVYLHEKYKLPINQNDSFQIMKDVLEGIVQIESHLLVYKPCQVFKEHIIYKEGRWGICNIICYRDPNEKKQRDPSCYWPIDYYEHPNEDAQLVWSIGRMWFELITNKQIPPIRSINQAQLNNLINNNVSDLKIVSMLEQILVINPKNRLTLQNLLTHQILQFPELSKINMHSLMPILSSNSIIKKKIAKENLYNPFGEELFKRDFSECIAIADLFEQVKKWIIDNYEIKDQNEQIQFSCYLIDLKSYLRLKNMIQTREKQQYDLALLSDKADYKKILERFLFLQTKLDRKRKVKKLKTFRQLYPSCFCKLTDISHEDVYKNFKKYLIIYSEKLKEKRLKNNPSCEQYAMFIKIILVRCADYVFKGCRKYIFQDFIETTGFELSAIIKNIQSCQSLIKLQNLDRRIQEIYFSKH